MILLKTIQLSEITTQGMDNCTAFSIKNNINFKTSKINIFFFLEFVRFLFILFAFHHIKIQWKAENVTQFQKKLLIEYNFIY